MGVPKPETKEDKFEFSPEELEAVTESFGSLVKMIKDRFSEQKKLLEQGAKNEGVSYEDYLNMIAAQEKWDKEKTSYGYVPKGAGWFAGGFKENVYNNLLFVLGVRVKGIMEECKEYQSLGVLALRRAIQEDPELKAYVETVFSATKKVQEGTPYKDAEALETNLL